MKLNDQRLTGRDMLVVSSLFSAVLMAAGPEAYDPAMANESKLFMDIP